MKEKEVELKVKTIATSVNKESSISNIVVQNLISVYQTSSIHIENATFELATIEYKLFGYNNNSIECNKFISIEFHSDSKIRKVEKFSFYNSSIDSFSIQSSLVELDRSFV